MTVKRNKFGATEEKQAEGLRARLRLLEDENKKFGQELEAASQQIAHLEGCLQEIASYKSHTKKVALVQLRRVDHAAQKLLQREQADRLDALPAIHDGDNVNANALLSEVQTYDARNLASLNEATRPSVMLRAYIKGSRGLFRLVRKGVRAVRGVLR